MDNSIKLAFGITDPNITLDKKYAQPVERVSGPKGPAIRCHLKLTYPLHCPKCGFLMVHNGWRLVEHQGLPSDGQPVLLSIRKQKYLCKNCHQTALAAFKDVAVNCHFTKRVKQKLAFDGIENISVKYIAKENFTSDNTVTRAMWALFEYNQPDFHFLPAHMAFDDFKAGRFAGSGMSIILMNIENHRVLDVIKDRSNYSLTKYFQRYSLAARAAVQTITVDLYQPYRQLIAKMFPNALIIADRFHVVVQAYTALQQVRIHFMNSLPKESRERRQLKKFWRLIVQNSEQINISKRYKRRNFRGALLTDDEVLHRILRLSPSLRAAYEYYQDLLYALKTNNKGLLEDLSARTHDSHGQKLPDEMKQAQKTIKHHFAEILNSFKSPWRHFTNGPIEGSNNKIKAIKRTAYGFRNFYNFRMRILIAFSNSYYAINYRQSAKTAAPPIGNAAA